MTDIELTRDGDTVTVQLHTASARAWVRRYLVDVAASGDTVMVPRELAQWLVAGAEGYGLRFEATRAYLEAKG